MISKAPAEEGNTGWAGEARLNAGRNFALSSIPFLGSVPGFLDAEVAYRLRTEGPPDEWHVDVTLGFKFTPKIMLMLQDYTTVSMWTKDPTFPAWRSSVAEASLVYALNDRWSISGRRVLDRLDGQDQQPTRRGGRRVVELLRSARLPGIVDLGAELDWADTVGADGRGRSPLKISRLPKAHNSN